MSEEPLRLGIAAEGISDYHILLAAAKSMAGGKPIVATLLQPEESDAFTGGGDAGPLGGGWKGVGKWCFQAARRGGGKLSGGLLDLFDVLILHLDADVAAEEPAEGSPFVGLPCEQPCPPAVDTTDALRAVMLRWTGESAIPARVVLCTPSKSMDAWVMEAFFPDDREMNRLGKECHGGPASRLAQQPKRARFSKSGYRGKAAEFEKRWTKVTNALDEARRYETEFVAALRS